MINNPLPTFLDKLDYFICHKYGMEFDIGLFILIFIIVLIGWLCKKTNLWIIKDLIEKIIHLPFCLLGKHFVYDGIFHTRYDCDGNSDGFKCYHCRYCDKPKDPKIHAKTGEIHCICFDLEECENQRKEK